MVIKSPGARTLGVLVMLLALGLLPAHGVLHHHHPPVGASVPCDHHDESPASALEAGAHAEGPCTLCHQVSSGVTLSATAPTVGSEAVSRWLACESDVDRRDVLRTRATVRGPPSA